MPANSPICSTFDMKLLCRALAMDPRFEHFARAETADHVQGVVRFCLIHLDKYGDRLAQTIATLSSRLKERFICGPLNKQNILWLRGDGHIVEIQHPIVVQLPGGVCNSQHVIESFTSCFVHTGPDRGSVVLSANAQLPREPHHQPGVIDRWIQTTPDWNKHRK